MADQSDVEAALVALASGALYPLGTDAASICGAPCRVYRGWPNAAALDADLAAGRVNVTVFPVENVWRNTTRYPEEWSIQSAPAPSLTASVSGLTATFDGAASPGQLAGLLVDGKSYVYPVQAGDTPALVAASLAALVRSNRAVNLDGGALTIPAAAQLVARVVAGVPSSMETRRQSQRFRLTCWCPSPASRDQVAVAIDVVLAGTRFLALADGSSARLLCQGGTVVDQAQDAALYRRDLIVDAEYPTTLVQQQPAMLFGDLMLNAAGFIA